MQADRHGGSLAGDVGGDGGADEGHPLAWQGGPQAFPGRCCAANPATIDRQPAAS